MKLWDSQYIYNQNKQKDNQQTCMFTNKRVVSCTFSDMSMSNDTVEVSLTYDKPNFY